MMKKYLLLSIPLFFAAALHAQSNVGIGTNDPKSKLDIEGGLSLREGSALSLVNGNNDNIVLTGNYSFYRITGPTAAFSILGLIPNSGADGQVLTLVNTTAHVMTIKNNASSTAAYSIRTLTGGDIVSVAGGSSITMQYNKTEQRWYVTGSQNFTVSSGSIATSDIKPGTNSAVTVVNGVGKAVGAGDVVLDVTNNALNQKGIVPGPTGGDDHRVWGTDAGGNPGWTKVGNDKLTNSTVTINTGSGLSGGGNVALGGTLNLVNTAPDQTVTLTGGGINTVSGTYPNFTVTGTEVDGSVTNEGSLTVGAGTASTSVINSNTSGSTPVTLQAGSNVTLTETGNTITIASSNSGGTVTNVATGSGLTGGPITTTGTISVATSGITSTHIADGTIAAGDLANTGVGAGTYNNVTVNAQGQVTAGSNTAYLTSEVDGNISNEGALTVGAGTASTSVINSNTSGSTPVTITAGSNITVSEVGNNITISSSNPGGTVTQVNTGAGLTGGPITGSGTISIANSGVTNAMLANSAITVNTSGVGLSVSGSPVSLGGAVTVTSNGTSNNTANTLVARDASGNFSAGQVNANLNGQWLRVDDRTIAPSDISSGYARFGFTSWANNNTAPYADFLHLRSYTDASGGNDNLVMFRKDAIGMRIYQQAWNSATPYAAFKDVAFTDGTNAAGTWGINISGNAATATSSTSFSGNLAGDVTGPQGATIVGDDSHNHTEIEAKPQYSWNAATAPNLFPQAVAASFVRAADGWPEYGSVLHVGTYPNDGGSLQLYAPYNSTYGGNSLRYRLGLYNNAGWTGWKTIWDDTNDGSGSGMDADMTDGFHASQSIVGNNIVVRDANGYIFGNYINTTDNSVGSGVTGIVVKQGNDYHRTATAAAVLSFLGITAPTGDNLGNHTATTTLNMNSNIISNVSAVNGPGDNIGFMTNRADDVSYEWLGFYSGGTRQGIFLWDGAWGGANNVTNEFSLTAENNNLLTLNASNHIALMPKGSSNVGVGTLSPAARLHVSGGAIRPQEGNATAAGINWGTDIYGGGGDQAWIRYYSEGGENTRLVIGNENDADDEIAFYQTGGERMTIYNGNVGIGVTTPSERVQTNGNIRADGVVYWGNGLVRTETRNDAGLRGDAGARSGFFETSSPTNYPAGATSWWHLIDSRHSNNTNNYAMQFAGSFFDQRFYARKTNNNASQAWSELLTVSTDNTQSANSAWTMAMHGQYSDDDLGGFGWTSSVDDSYFSTAMPFPLRINGGDYYDLTLNTNGTIVFGSQTTYLSYGGTLPNSGTTLPILAWYWRDMVTRYRYGTVGTSPNRVFIIDFDSNAYNTGDDVDGQIQIHETSGLVNVFYRVMDPNVNGQNGVVGFQLNGGSSAKVYPIVGYGKTFDDNRLPQSWSVSPVR